MKCYSLKLDEDIAIKLDKFCQENSWRTRNRTINYAIEMYIDFHHCKEDRASANFMERDTIMDNFCERWLTHRY